MRAGALGLGGVAFCVGRFASFGDESPSSRGDVALAAGGAAGFGWGIAFRDSVLAFFASEMIADSDKAAAFREEAGVVLKKGLAWVGKAITVVATATV